MAKERVDRELGEAFFPFKQGFQVSLSIVRGRGPISLDFRIDKVFGSNSACYFVCEGAQFLNEFAAATRKDHTFIDPISRLNLFVSLPDGPTLTAKVRPGYLRILELRYWFYDPSLTLPRVKSKDALAATTLPALMTPLALGTDLYSTGEPYGGKLLVKNDPHYLDGICVTFNLTDPSPTETIILEGESDEPVSSFSWEGLKYTPTAVLYALVKRTTGLARAEIVLDFLRQNGTPANVDDLIKQAGALRAFLLHRLEEEVIRRQRAFREELKRDRF